MTIKKKKPNCYNCKYRGEVVGSCHSSCNHPKCENLFNDPVMSVISILGSVRGGIPPISTGLKIKGNEHGIRSGWFNHPMNFDPIWLEECNGFKKLT